MTRGWQILWVSIIMFYIFSVIPFVFGKNSETWAWIAQSVQRLATYRTVRGSNPDEGEIFRTHPDWPWGLPSLLYSGYRVVPGGKAAGA